MCVWSGVSEKILKKPSIRRKVFRCVIIKAYISEPHFFTQRFHVSVITKQSQSKQEIHQIVLLMLLSECSVEERHRKIVKNWMEKHFSTQKMQCNVERDLFFVEILRVKLASNSNFYAFFTSLLFNIMHMEKRKEKK